LTPTSPKPVSNLDSALTADIVAISRIDAVASILEVICRTTGMGFAALARVTKDRWVACAVRDEIAFGLLPGGELDVKTTICDEIRDSGRPVIIDHVAEDENFRDHHTPRIYGRYISMPIILPSGAFFGTLCAIDPRPARLNTPEVVGMFKNFAQLIAFYLDAQERAAKQDAALLDAQEAAKLREQFVAILAHDLRNPLASIDAGVGLILRTQPDEKTRSVAERIRNSVKRMVSLIDDTLDFAKARLGAGSNWSVTPVRRLSFQQTEYVVRQRRQDLRRRFQFPPRRRAGNALHKGAKTCMDLLPAGRPLPRPLVGTPSSIAAAIIFAMSRRQSVILSLASLIARASASISSAKRSNSSARAASGARSKPKARVISPPSGRSACRSGCRVGRPALRPPARQAAAAMWMAASRAF
jgi:His Kinase A (phospho-acceptor) domain/GAF domain